MVETSARRALPGRAAGVCAPEGAAAVLSIDSLLLLCSGELSDELYRVSAFRVSGCHLALSGLLSTTWACERSLSMLVRWCCTWQCKGSSAWRAQWVGSTATALLRRRSCACTCSPSRSRLLSRWTRAPRRSCGAWRRRCWLSRTRRPAAARPLTPRPWPVCRRARDMLAS